MPERPEVRQGQIWEERSGPRVGRLLAVEETDPSGAGITVLRRIDTGRKTVMRTTMLRPPRFDVVAYGCRPGDCAPDDDVIPPEAIGTMSTGWRWVCPHGRPHRCVGGRWLWRFAAEESTAMRERMTR